MKVLKFNQELTHKQGVDLGVSLALLLAIKGVLTDTHTNALWQKCLLYFANLPSSKQIE